MGRFRPRIGAIMPTGRFDSLRGWAWSLLCVMGVPSLGCSYKAADRATAAYPVEKLPSYDTDAAHVFDDSIAPEVFGLQLERTDPANDQLLQQRLRLADHVVRVKLRTILEERFADSLRYRIIVQPLGVPIAGDALPTELELTVGRASPSLSMLRSMSVEAVGAKFILLLKRYQLDNEPVFHFRGEPDQGNVLAAIQQANSPKP